MIMIRLLTIWVCLKIVYLIFQWIITMFPIKIAICGYPPFSDKPIWLIIWLIIHISHIKYHPIHHWSSGSPTDSGTRAPRPAAAAACAAAPSNLNDGPGGGARQRGNGAPGQGKRGKSLPGKCQKKYEDLESLWKILRLSETMGKTENPQESQESLWRICGTWNINRAKGVRKPQQIYEMINGSSRSWEEKSDGWANLSEDKTRTMD